MKYIACLLLLLMLNAMPARSQTAPPMNIPIGATAISGSGGGTAGPIAAVLGATAGVTTYFCAFVTSTMGGSTIGTITVSGLAGSSTLSQVFAPTMGIVQQQQVFTPCLPASAPNTPITITATVDGTPMAINVNGWGYQQ